jgi:hypothetical protein
MNLFKFLLAFYFMALSLMPCEDVHKESGSDQVSLSFAADQSHSKDKGDICSPLCVCNCCQMAVSAFVKTILPIRYTTTFGSRLRFNF